VSLLDHAEIQIVWRSGSALSAVIRGPHGLVDVHWSAENGWSCSRCQDHGCAHTLAVRQLAAVATA
jgi:hypothetical protein